MFKQRKTAATGAELTPAWRARPTGRRITAHIPLTFRKRGGRKRVVTPDGAEWAPRPRVDNAMVKALARAAALSSAQRYFLAAMTVGPVKS